MILYGTFLPNNTLYRMLVNPDVDPISSYARTIVPFKSSTYLKEDAPKRILTNMVKVNTGEFFRQDPNDVLYKNILDLIKVNKISGVDTLFPSLKIALDYIIADADGNIIDGGVRYIQDNAETFNVLLNINPVTKALPYRKAMRIHKVFEIVRAVRSGYGVMQNKPTALIFKINSIKVYGNVTDKASQYYLTNLGPAAQDMTYKYGSVNIASIEKNSLVLFDSNALGIDFQQQTIMYIPESVNVDIDILMNQFCALDDDSEILGLIADNNPTNDIPDLNYIFPGYSPFDPVVNRRPCPGNIPMVPDPRHLKPLGPIPPCPPPPGPGPRPIPPFPPMPAIGQKIPINPGKDWDPTTPLIPDLKEYVKTYVGDPEGLIVVEDDKADFDPKKEVKYSAAKMSIEDIEVGDFVKVKSTDVNIIYVKTTEDDADAYLVVPDNTILIPSERQLKISMVKLTLEDVKVGDYVKAKIAKDEEETPTDDPTNEDPENTEGGSENQQNENTEENTDDNNSGDDNTGDSTNQNEGTDDQNTENNNESVNTDDNTNESQGSEDNQEQTTEP